MRLWGCGWGRRRESGPGTALGGRKKGVGRSSGLLRDCRNLEMESLRFAGGTTGCQAVGGFLMTEHSIV